MPGNTLNIIRASLLKTVYFTRFFLRHFYTLRGMQTASFLAYTTLLSLVPLVAVMFGLFGQVSILRGVSESIQDFIFSNFVPQFGWTVQGYIVAFSDKASQLTISGCVVLIVIALMLMATIDNTFNRIWFVRNKRNPMARLLVYWAVLTMSPILIGVGLASTSYLLSIPVVADVDTSLNLKARLLSWLPFLTTSVAFTLLYILVPNCYVPKRYALVGGVVCAVLFEVAKFGFGLYVRAMPGYETIYGAISVIPLFLIWLYVSWVIVLLGACMTFCLSSFSLTDEMKRGGYQGWTFLDVLHVLEQLYSAQKAGRTVSVTQAGKTSMSLPQHKINDLLDHLKRYNWVNHTNGRWLLSVDLKQASLFDLYRILPVKLPFLSEESNSDLLSKKLNTYLDAWQKQLPESLAVPVAEVFSEDTV